MDDKAITEYFKGSWIYLLHNQIRFDSQKFGHDSIIKESAMMFIPVSTQSQLQRKLEVQRTELKLQDLVVDLDEITELTNSQVFSLKDVGTIPYEYDNTVFSVLIGGSNDQLVIERSNYSVFDLLGDIGGLESIIFSFVTLMLSALNYNHLDNELVSRLFRFKNSSQSGDDSQFYKVTRTWNVCNLFMDCIPTFCLCCAKSKRNQAFELARKKLEQETDIV